MKGQDWYQTEEVAEGYEAKRFTGGGRLIDERERRAVREGLAPVKGRRILEIACGTGRFVRMLARKGADAVGMDISGPMLERARADAPSGGSAPAYLRADAARLPFPDDAFDAAFAVRFLHLADDPVPFLREMRRVSRDRVLFDTFNARTARSVYSWLLPMGSRLYDEEEVRGLLAEAGLSFRDVRSDFVVPYGIYRGLPEWFADPLRSVDTAVLDTGIGERLASVSYWTATVD